MTAKILNFYGLLCEKHLTAEIPYGTAKPLNINRNVTSLPRKFSGENGFGKQTGIEITSVNVMLLMRQLLAAASFHAGFCWLLVRHSLGKSAETCSVAVMGWNIFGLEVALEVDT